MQAELVAEQGRSQRLAAAVSDREEELVALKVWRAWRAWRGPMACSPWMRGSNCTLITRVLAHAAPSVCPDGYLCAATMVCGQRELADLRVAVRRGSAELDLRAPSVARTDVSAHSLDGLGVSHSSAGPHAPHLGTHGDHDDADSTNDSADARAGGGDGRAQVAGSEGEGQPPTQATSVYGGDDNDVGPAPSDGGVTRMRYSDESVLQVSAPLR